jgi:hypothetical protein
MRERLLLSLSLMLLGCDENKVVFTDGKVSHDVRRDAPTVDLATPDTRRPDLGRDLKTDSVVVGPSWAAKIGGAGAEEGNGVALDKSGNIYVTGAFIGTANIGGKTITSQGLQDVYVAKYSPAGQLAWVTTAGGAGLDIGTGVAVDGSDNVYISGGFSGQATFGSTTLTSKGKIDVFMAKLSPGGQFTWATPGGGTDDDYLYGIAVDGSGDAYGVGYFKATATFGSQTLTSQGFEDILVLKTAPDGQLAWAATAGKEGWDVGVAIALDGSGAPHVTGYFFKTVAFGSTSLTSAGTEDLFVAKLAPTSGAFQWAASAGGTKQDEGLGIALDSQDSVYVTGFFQGQSTFDTTTLTSAGAEDLFVARYTSTGKLAGVVQGGGSGSDEGLSVAVDATGNVYVTGYFNGQAAFGGTKLSAAGDDDAVIGKLATTPTLAMTWATSGGGSGKDRGYFIAAGAGGKVYVSGIFNGTATFGSAMFTSQGGDDSFLWMATAP